MAQTINLFLKIEKSISIHFMLECLLSAIFFPLLLSPLFFLLSSYIPRYLGFVALLFAASSFTGVVAAGTLSGWGEAQVLQIPWVTSLGVNLTFIIDGLSLFFGILVTAMGVLVTWYAQYYMDPKDPHLGRFYACLMFFMGSMLGTVFSSNLMILFLFWEFTGAASFLLIGYWHPKEAAWKGARMSILVTGFTGLSLLAGIILLNSLSGTFEWNIMVTEKIPYSEWFYPIIICFLIGIFGKSAQFPFYFWLPNAMTAPTPVSAYLHAATMVKLGVFLTARMYPLFVGYDTWFYMLTSFGFITLLLGAVLSLLSNDLKAILAYATVSQLGFFLAQYGIGGEEGVEYDFVHILNHSFYKGSLFMLVGIVEHATGIRDVRKLGGLWNKLPLTTLIFFIAAAAMAGIPGTTGFLSKELMISEIIAYTKFQLSGWIFLGIVIMASLLKVAIALRIFYHLFVRNLEDIKGVRLLHTPSLGVQIPPLILSSVAFLFGVLPSQLGNLTSYFYVSGLHNLETPSLHIWQGWTAEIGISTTILVCGALLFYAADKRGWYFTNIAESLNLGDVFERFVTWMPQMGNAVVKRWEPSSYQAQLSVLFALFGFGLGGYLLLFTPLNLHWGSLSLVRFLTLSTIFLFTVLLILFRNPISRLLSLSGCGFFLAVYFALFKAPDLAMTQVLVEVAISLFILLLFRHLGSHLHLSDPLFSRRQIGPIILSLACGTTAALISGLYYTSYRPMMEFFIRNTVPVAHGSNTVNTILIDFRGLDTLGESTALLTAMLGIIGLLASKKFLRSKESDPKIPIDSTILASIMPLIFIILNLFSLYLLLRGHNYPGGGFIAGVASGVAIIILGITITRVAEKVPLLRIVGFTGLGMILLSGVLPLFFDAPFFTQYASPYTSQTPLIFDTGVYLIVLAMVAKIYFLLRQARLKEAQ